MKTQIFHDGFEGHVRRSLDRTARREKGEHLPAERIFTFDNRLDVLECFTVQRVRLLETVKKQSLSISALAEELGRNRGSVTRDVNKLRKIGLVRLRDRSTQATASCKSLNRSQKDRNAPHVLDTNEACTPYA